MNKEEFLRQLEGLLSDISEEERADAMAYYRSYFEDAGPENEEAILAELESPEKVAHSIRTNLGVEQTAEASFRKDDGEGMQNPGEQKRRKNKHAAIAIGICAAVLLSPFWLVLLAFIAAVIMCVAALVFAVVAMVAGVVISGFVILGVGIGALFGGSPAVGLGLSGGGLLVLALGLLAVILLVWLCGCFVPWVCRQIGRFCFFCKKRFAYRKEKKTI